MDYCKNCGKRLDDGAKFCPDCGIKQESNDIFECEDSENKTLTGFAVGFVLSFSLGLIGYVLCTVLGDKSCKIGSTYGLITSAVFSVILGIIIRTMVF